jgi:hypothetical protein
LFTSYSNAQELIPGETYTTPNIVLPPTTGQTSSWAGAVNQNSLTCWGQGDPGYCGPNPITLPNGNIHFSYGSTYIFQQQAVASILPQITGLQVTGFNFGFTAKNGNGWDDGRVDQLSAVVRFWDTSGGRGLGNLLERREYSLNYRFNWTQFNYSENFVSPLTANKIGQVQYGFIGRDNNGWTGPYGPEITGVNFSLKYSVDPCQTNPLSSPTCSGYLAALAKLLPPPMVVEPVAQMIQQEVLQPVMQTSVVSLQSTQPAQQSQPVQQTQQSATAAGPGLGFALNLISRNAARERAVTQQAVQQATQDAAASTDRAVQQAASAALASVSGDAANSTQQTTTGITQNFALRQNLSQQSTVVGQETASLPVSQQSQFVQVLVQTTASPNYTPTTQESSTGTSTAETSVRANLTLVEPATVQITTVQASQFKTEDSLPVQLTGNFLTDPTNPLRSILDAQPQTQQDQPTQSVKNNVQDSALAGGITVASLGGLPQGYTSYLQLQLQDAKFYESKPIYQNQRVIDNARVLRGLGSDALHQRLVQSQYK